MLDEPLNAIERLIEPGRVSRRVYTDPEVFELEMQRVFGRSWLFVGHDSQIPNSGDFLTTELGRQPVIMIRHYDDTVRVLLNRCTHRGAKVLNEPTGNAPRMSCLYHGWTFSSDGALVGVPEDDGCTASFDRKDFGLASVPRLETYRGFVFASLAATGISLEEHLGGMKANIDDMVDRAPEGKLALDVGVHRYIFPGNWKLQVENVLDSYHVPFGHASTVNKEGDQFSRRDGDEKGAKVIEKDKTSEDWKIRRSYDMGHGHGWTSNTKLDDGKRSSAVYSAYVDALTEKLGEKRAAEVLKPKFHNSLLYPNVSIMGLNIHVRVIKPIAVNLTEVNVYPIRLVGASKEMNAANIRLLNVTHSAASFVQSDDAESFTRVQSGLRSQLTEWVDISRGMGTEDHDQDVNAPRGKATDELVVRGQYRAWLDYMREAV
ncbi:MAG: aromatic ring-hydroxylating oxygenase subunit alpha [Rhodospirillales bacterium]|jgi:phenylpropionate dioxygenase-like ring-hydroxylating dioxygenase large terminal subunit